MISPSLWFVFLKENFQRIFYLRKTVIYAVSDFFCKISINVLLFNCPDKENQIKVSLSRIISIAMFHSVQASNNYPPCCEVSDFGTWRFVKHCLPCTESNHGSISFPFAPFRSLRDSQQAKERTFQISTSKIFFLHSSPGHSKGRSSTQIMPSMAKMFHSTTIACW